MRLKKLTMQAFGPFKEKVEIDFENERIDKGLLLITGDTGAGKTTIFDAICFALYGVASGNTRDAKSFRSDFANINVPTFVELEFYHKNKLYNIKRWPEQHKVTSRGISKNPDPAKAEFEINERKIVKSTEVTKAVEELIGLDIKQFSQVAMLSQGEFTKFLLASSDEKTSIFRKIFNTEIYNTISEKLYAKYKSQEEKCKEITSYIEKQKLKLTEIDYSNLLDSELVEAVKEKIEKDTLENKNLEKERTSLNKKVTEKTAKIQEVEKMNEKINSLNENKEALDSLKEENKNIEEERKLLEYNTNISFKITNNLNLLNKEKNTLEESEDILKSSKVEKEEVKSILESKKELFASLSGYSDKVQKFTENLAEKNDLINKYKKKEELLNEIEENKENIKIAIEKYEEENNKLLEMEKSYYLNEAYALSSILKDGESCPVCGSKVHPCVAKKPEGICTLEELNIQKEVVKKALESKNTVQRKTEVLNKQIEELKLAKDINIEEVIKNKDSLAEELENLKENYNKLTEEQKDLNLNLEKVNSKINIYTENIEKSKKEITNLNKKLEEIYLENKTNLEEYNKNKLEDSEFKILNEKVKIFDNIFNKLTTTIDMLSKETEGKKIEDITLEKEKLENITAEYNEIDAKYIDLNSKIEILKSIYTSLKENIEEYEVLSKKLSILKGLADTTYGKLNGKAKITFENFVQAYYLRNVLTEANKRLDKMTDGRFELRKKEEPGNKNKKTGLDFTIFDAYTGKERDVGSLSGGEKFKASLSLALGLSDVISMFAGGIKIDMLFVDEGFGSLDGESLNQALNTLSNLVDGDKFVGIISHVSELISRIDNKIMVKKNSDGSYLEIEA